MHRNLPFRTILLFTFWVFLVCALLIPSFYYNHTLTAEILKDGKEAAIQQLNLLHWTMTNGRSFRDTDELQDWLASLGRQLGLRITYMAAGGKVIADSQMPVSEIANLENYSTKPEIVQTRDDGIGLVIRRSDVFEKQQIFAARRIPARGGLPAGVLRVGSDLSKMQDQVDRLKSIFTLILICFFVGTVFLSYLLVRHLRAPIASFIDAIQKIALGDYSKRVHFTPDHEFYPMARAFNQMAEDLGTCIRDISDERDQLEAVFNGMREGVLVIDSRGRIETINRALGELVSHPLQCIGRRPMEVFLNLELQAACDEVLSPKGDIGLEETSLQIVMGRDRTYDVNIVKLHDLHGDSGAIVVFHDISELKRLAKVRQDFVANVSHELRTPLTSIKGYAETLLSEGQEEQPVVVPFLEVILRNANHMVKMVDDLLQLARLDSPAKPVQLMPVEVDETVALAWKACLPLAEEKAIRLVNRLPQGGVHVMADFDQLVQVFRNLLENAVKYSPHGSAITIASQAYGKRLALSVRDEGPGIPKQYHERIFERFYRIEKDRSTYPGSTGLGLAITRHIVLNHGGSIWVQSPNDEGRGTTFFFTMAEAADAEAVEA